MTYPVAGELERTARERAAATGQETFARRKVLDALLELTTTYSRYGDHLTTAQLAARARVDETTVRRAFRWFAQVGVATREKGRKGLVPWTQVLTPADTDRYVIAGQAWPAIRPGGVGIAGQALPAIGVDIAGQALPPSLVGKETEDARVRAREAQPPDSAGSRSAAPRPTLPTAAGEELGSVLSGAVRRVRGEHATVRADVTVHAPPAEGVVEVVS